MSDNPFQSSPLFGSSHERSPPTWQWKGSFLWIDYFAFRRTEGRKKCVHWHRIIIWTRGWRSNMKYSKSRLSCCVFQLSWAINYYSKALSWGSIYFTDNEKYNTLMWGREVKCQVLRVERPPQLLLWCVLCFCIETQGQGKWAIICQGSGEMSNNMPRVRGNGH